MLKTIVSTDAILYIDSLTLHTGFHIGKQITLYRFESMILNVDFQGESFLARLTH